MWVCLLFNVRAVCLHPHLAVAVGWWVHAAWGGRKEAEESNRWNYLTFLCTGQWKPALGEALRHLRETTTVPWAPLKATYIFLSKKLNTPPYLCERGRMPFSPLSPILPKPNSTARHSTCNGCWNCYGRCKVLLSLTCWVFPQMALASILGFSTRKVLLKYRGCRGWRLDAGCMEVVCIKPRHYSRTV